MLADLHIYGGLAVLAAGLALIHPGIGLAALGLGFVALGVMYALTEKPAAEPAKPEETES